MDILHAGSSSPPTPSGCADQAGMIDALDRDQVIINDVHHLVPADPQPVMAASVEGFRWIWVLS